MMLLNIESKFLGEKQFYLKSREKNIPGVTPSKDYIEMVYFFTDYYYFVVEDRSEMSGVQSVRIDEQELMTHLRVNQSSTQLFLTIEQISRAVKIRGFLHNIKKIDVIEFLKDFEIYKYNVFIKRGPKEKSGVEVVVIMNTSDERERVCRTLSNRLFRNRLIEIYPYS